MAAELDACVEVFGVFRDDDAAPEIPTLELGIMELVGVVVLLLLLDGVPAPVQCEAELLLSDKFDGSLNDEG